MLKLLLCAFIYLSYTEICSTELGKFAPETPSSLDHILLLLGNKDIQKMFSSIQVQNTTIAIFQGAMGFLRRVGILPSNTTSYCNTLANDFYNLSVQSLKQVFIPSTMLIGAVNLLQSAIEVRVMVQKCPEEMKYVYSKFDEYSHLNYYTIADRLFNRSGIIAYNVYNSLFAIQAKDYFRAGAWIGTGIYNILNKGIRDEPIFGNNY